MLYPKREQCSHVKAVRDSNSMAASTTATEPNADSGGGGGGGVVVAVEGDLGKECHALGVLFQQIVNELKVGCRTDSRFISSLGRSVITPQIPDGRVVLRTCASCLQIPGKGA